MKDRIWLPYAGVDLRSLALFRVLMALAALISVCSYWPYVDIFFAPKTGLSLRQEPAMWHPENWSLLYAFDGIGFFYAFLAVYALAATALLFGYQTRLATIICWICAVSLKNRGVQFSNFGDTLHAVYFFWAMFLPLGAAFSVDAALNKKTPYSPRYASIASLGLLLNVTYLYVFGALHKTGYDWQSLTAVHYALSNTEVTTFLAPYLLAQSWLIKPLTAYVYYLELCSPLLLFLPVYTAQARLVGVFLLASLHIGFAMFLHVGLFSLIGVAGLTAFLPALFWDKVTLWINRRKTRQGIHIFYDRDCGFCLKLCKIFRALGLPAATPITPAQDDAVAGPILTEQNTWVVRTHRGTLLTHWEAVSYIWRRSPILWPLGMLFMLPGLKELGHAVYLLIAYNRKSLADMSAVWLPYHDNPPYMPHRITAAAISCLTALVFAHNLRNAEILPNATWPAALEQTLDITQLRQKWYMYAPYVRNSGDWLVMEGVTSDKAVVDVWRAELSPPSHARPAYDANTHLSMRLRRHLFLLIRWKHQGVRVARLFCRRFHEEHPYVALDSVTIYLYWQMTAAPGNPPNKPQRKIVYQGKCT